MIDLTPEAMLQLQKWREHCNQKRSALNQLVNQSRPPLPKPALAGLHVAKAYWDEQKAAVDSLLAPKTMGFVYEGEEY